MLRVALGTSDRVLTLARLTVMGHERPTRLVLLETLPAVVLAVAAAVACALALPPLSGAKMVRIVIANLKCASRLWRFSNADGRPALS